MAAKLRKGDKIIVISGKDKSKTGEVTRVIPKAVSYTHLTLPTNREV